MVRVPFDVSLSIHITPVRTAELCKIDCFAESAVNGPALENVYAIAREADGTEHEIEMLPHWPYCAKHPVLAAMGPAIWEEARSTYVTRELETMWEAEGETKAERRANAYADYLHDQRHG